MIDNNMMRRLLPDRAEATRAGIPLDAVILSLSLLGALVRPPNAPATVIAVIATFLLGLYWLVAVLCRDGAGEYGGRAFRAQLGIALALIGLVVVLPTVTAIGYRHARQPWNAIHDSPLQIELATGMLLHGQDYYRATYVHTPLAHWWPFHPPNPALYHTDSLPFQEELTVPAMLAAKAALGFFDERMLYIVCLGLVVVLALRLARAPSSRLALLAGLCLNPLFVPTFIVGQNDVLVLAEVMGALALARARRPRLALLLLGTTLATKETALFLLPFLLLWLAGQEGVRRDSAGLLWLLRALGWVLLPVALFVGPFLLWDAPAFLDSTIGFVEGTVAHSFPIRGLEGYGFASFVLFGHLVRSDTAYWPFGIVQLLVAGPVALGLLWRQWRDNTLARAVAGYTTVLFLMYYFGRFFHASFIAYALSLAMLAYFIDGRGTGARARENGARTHLSLDFLLVLLVVPQSLARPTTPALALYAAAVMGVLTLYVLVDAYTDGWAGTGVATALARRSWRLRVGLVGALLALVVAWPEVQAMLIRRATHPWYAVHDTAMQVEEAIKFLLAGKDYYAQTYLHTPMVHWYASPGMTAALYHTDRPPFGIVASAPFYLAGKALFGFFDERMVYLPLLVLCAALLLRLPVAREWRLAAIAGVLLNPFFVPTLVYGQDDVLVLALLLLCGAALYGGRYGRAALWLGLACATKHTAVFMLPPYLLYVAARHNAEQGRDWRATVSATWREAWPALIVPLLIYAPFLVWHARAFLDGNIGFLAGTVQHSYPIRGVGTYGFSALVLLGGLVRSPDAYYPFALWEAAAALPVLAFVGRRLWRAPSVQGLFAAYALLLFACYFFSRFFQDSGLAYAVSMLVLSALLPRAPQTAAAAATRDERMRAA